MNQTADIGRNDPCPCGSGRKYKQCCLAKDEEARRKARAKEAKKAAKAGSGKGKDKEKTEDKHADASRDAKAAPHPPTRGPSDQPWKRNPGGAHPTQRRSLPRKVGK